MSALDGLKAGFPPGIGLPGRFNPEPEPATTASAASSPLRFEGWDARPGKASITGEARMAGNPAEHRAIAQSIVELILEPAR
jgi:hypothetical protein